MSHSFEHHTEGVQELAEEARRGVARIEQIASNVERSMQHVADIAVDTARQSSQVEDAVHALGKTVERAANKTIVRDASGRPIGTRIAD
jgi:methyl-accepting chemotaxis protein